MGKGEERVRCMERVTWKIILPYVKYIAGRNFLYGSGKSNSTGICCMAQETLYQPTRVGCRGRRWEGVSKGRGYMYAVAAAKSLQSCPTLWDSIDCSPPGSPVPGILQARTLEWVYVYLWLTHVEV